MKQNIRIRKFATLPNIIQLQKKEERKKLEHKNLQQTLEKTHSMEPGLPHQICRDVK